MNRSILKNTLLTLSLAGASLAFAPGASAALSGSCGMLSGMPHTFDTPQNSSSYDLDVMAIIDFTNSQITYSMNTMTIDSVGGQTTTTGLNGPTPFTSVTGSLPGSTDITFSTGGGTVTLELLPVNSGNTILIQAKNDAFHGVCQML